MESISLGVIHDEWTGVRAPPTSPPTPNEMRFLFIKLRTLRSRGRPGAPVGSPGKGRLVGAAGALGHSVVHRDAQGIE